MTCAGTHSAKVGYTITGASSHCAKVGYTITGTKLQFCCTWSCHRQCKLPFLLRTSRKPTLICCFWGCGITGCGGGWRQCRQAVAAWSVPIIHPEFAIASCMSAVMKQHCPCAASIHCSKLETKKYSLLCPLSSWCMWGSGRVIYGNAVSGKPRRKSTHPCLCVENVSCDHPFCTLALLAGTILESSHFVRAFTWILMSIKLAVENE